LDQLKLTFVIKLANNISTYTCLLDVFVGNKENKMFFFILFRFYSETKTSRGFTRREREAGKRACRQNHSTVKIRIKIKQKHLDYYHIVLIKIK
jgi:hypothetical protein